MRPQLRYVVVSFERHLTREQLVEHAAEGVDVCTAVDLLAANLLRGDVVERPHPLPGGRQTAVRRGSLRQPEVQIEYEGAIAGTVKCLERIIRRGVDQGVFRCKAIDAAASAVVAAIQGYFVLGAAARSTVPRGSAASSTKRMVDGMLDPVRLISKQRGRR